MIIFIASFIFCTPVFRTVAS